MTVNAMPTTAEELLGVARPSEDQLRQIVSASLNHPAVPSALRGRVNPPGMLIMTLAAALSACHR